MNSKRMPAWVNFIVVPALNLCLAAIATGVAIALIGEDPFRALQLLVAGAFGDGDLVPYAYAWGYTLFYASGFIFTGLAFSVGMRAGLFNIGAEGQLVIGALVMSLVVLSFGFLPSIVLIPLAIVAAMAAGAGWAAIPALLYVKRQSHVVITTIMMNFIAASISVYFIVDLLSPAGSGATESSPFNANSFLPSFAEVASWFGISIDPTPGNVGFLIAVAAAVALWVMLIRTRMGYELRTVGASPQAAAYAGIKVSRIAIIAMCISGALAGLVGVNDLLGFHHKLILGFATGIGFGGVAVAMMARLHPIGIIAAGILFGALVQGGAELSFEMPTIKRELVIAIQGFVIYFTAASEYLLAGQLAKMWDYFGNNNAAGCARKAQS